MTDKTKLVLACGLLAVAAAVVAYTYWPAKKSEAAPEGPTVNIVCKACGKTTRTAWGPLAPILKSPAPRTGMRVPCPACGQQASIEVP